MMNTGKLFEAAGRLFASALQVCAGFRNIASKVLDVDFYTVRAFFLYFKTLHKQGL